jgi:hypothetical protein
MKSLRAVAHSSQPPAALMRGAMEACGIRRQVAPSSSLR